MTFLNPGVLWGLLALAVPIIVHFFNLQRPKQVLFSNVAFVREVKKTVVRRVKFKQWLLLLMRLLALTALVLAFANPVIVSEDQAMLQGSRSVAIVIDNSYSMTAANEKGGYFPQAVSLARNIIKAYGKQDEFLLMTTSDLRLNYNFIEQDEGLEALKDLEINQNIRPHTDLLTLGEEIFSRAGNRNKELYFLSDFQEATVMADSQEVALSDTSIRYKYLPLATREQRNVCVTDHRFTSQILEKDKPMNLSMTLVNDGNTAVRDLSVRILLEGKVAAISNKDLEPNASERLDITFTPSQSGWISGYIELDDNPIDFDNRRYFSFYVPEQEKVLVVEGQSSRNLRILYESLFESFETDFIAARNVSATQFSPYRSLILLGVTNISTGLADKLNTFLAEGGSLMFFPGEGMDLEAVNAWLKAAGVGAFAEARGQQAGVLADQIDQAHPLFEGIFTGDQANRSIDAPLVYRYYPLSLSGNFVQDRIISLPNQAPILAETRLDNGLLFLWSVFPGDSWTDLHVKTLFTPLMFRATQIMNQTRMISSGQEIGNFSPLSLRTNEKALIYLENAAGQQIPPEQYARGGATTLNFEKMDLAEGNYRIIQEGEELEKISFNISDLESRLAFADAGALGEALESRGLSEVVELVPAEPDDISERIQVEKEGFPLWKYLLVAALLFLLGEVLILRIKEQPVA
jgi:hypothetical protein